MQCTSSTGAGTLVDLLEDCVNGYTEVLSACLGKGKRPAAVEPQAIEAGHQPAARGHGPCALSMPARRGGAGKEG